MSAELTKEKFIARLKNREGGEYLYQISVLKTPNENYTKYAHEYILGTETEEIGCGKLQLKGINKIRRKDSYKYSHSKTAQSGSGRGEEWFVLDLFEKNKEYAQKVFGNVIDYQIPLKNSREDKRVGKIDFIYEKDGELYIAEIKAADSDESAMKAIIEVQTYYQIVDKEKLLEDYGKSPDTKINKAIVLFKNAKGGKQVCENELIKDLIDKFDINVVLL
ncbi:MAG: hypothetical protein K2J16_04005 [Clostridia bacterium]|nr:hypothetical protein [Clostridia bacterium]